MPGRKLFTPTGLLLDFIQNFQRPRLMSRQLFTKRQRILPGLMRKFINHALNNKHIMGWTDPPPPERRHRIGFIPDKFNQLIRHRIRCLGRPFHRIRVKTVLHPLWRPARRDR
ncbi:hypothetical protein Amal_01309 [Acetobacter malorum]|uniref:Uncharacterized protein n=1 Tax=Acetobacter malorum TaxID=178901 RepID=A0A177GCR1_9PROT|nr:hypothetical protein Amal_01309 [Acetobacter malorum]